MIGQGGGKVKKKGLSIVRLVSFSLGIILLGYGSLNAEADKPVLYLHFDEGEGEVAKDSSGSGNDGKIYGATWVKEGKIGPALSFDGVDDYVDCGNDARLNITEALTVELWIRPQFTTNYEHYVGKGVPGINSWIIGKIKTENRSYFDMWKDSAVNNVDSYVDLAEGVWTHLAGTFENGIVNIYVDGVLENTLSSFPTTLPHMPTESLYVGKSGGGYYAGGIIDEVRIYDRVLTDKEIKSHYEKADPD